MVVIMLESVKAFAERGRLEAAGPARLERQSEAYAVAHAGMRLFAARDLAGSRGLADSAVLDPSRTESLPPPVQFIGATMRPANAATRLVR